MIRFIQLLLSLFFMLYGIIAQGQMKFNIMGGNQILNSSDWSDNSNYDFSIKASLEIPISKKNSNYTIVPNIRYQKDDLFYDYTSYNHKGTRTFIYGYEYFEYGQFQDVKFMMNKYLFGINFQSRIIDQLYMSLGSGMSMNVYKNLRGKSTSNLHYYEIDLAQYELETNVNAYYSVNLQYKFPIIDKIDIVFGSEFIYHQKFNIDVLNILEISQYSFHLEVGVGYRFY